MTLCAQVAYEVQHTIATAVVPDPTTIQTSNDVYNWLQSLLTVRNPCPTPCHQSCGLCCNRLEAPRPCGDNGPREDPIQIAAAVLI